MANEVEPNNTPATGQPVDLPIRILGLSNAGINFEDWYTFYDNMSGIFEFVGSMVIGAAAVVEFCEFDDQGRTLNQSCQTLTAGQTVSMVKSKFYSSRITTAGPGASSYDVVYAVTNLDTSSVAPVDWLGFEATHIENTVQLLWSTATEENNQGFFIERSPDAQHWEDRGFIEGQGTTQEVQHYAFIDAEPLLGFNYYRLRQRDFNGDTDYSPIRAVVIDSGIGNFAIQVFPNPAVDQVSVTPLIGTISLMDVTGKLLQQRTVNGLKSEISLRTLPPGVYLLAVDPYNRAREIHRIYKQ